MIPRQLLARIFVAVLGVLVSGMIHARNINDLQSTQASDQFIHLSLGGITATPQRDAAGDISGYVCSDGGTNTVTQTWTRGPGGRIESAGSDVPGAPSFDYLIDPQTPEESFDSFGRRLKCETAGGIWTYEYGSWVYDENTSSWVFDSSFGGQLASATHPTLGTFTYQFDSIGRRIDEGAENTTDLLNRTTAWTHDQQKTITINADPNARVWFNGTEVTGFSGSHQEAVTPPGPDGGWATYDVLAILEDAGDGFGNPAPNPLASPDAKAEKSGAVWVPPAAETLTYDAAGNRQSSALWDYGWNAKNQLTRIRTKGHTTAPQAYDLTFAYDAEGRRVKKHVVEYRDGSVVAEKTVLYLWDGWDLLYERHQLPSGLTTLERKYLWGPDIANGAAGGAGGLLLIQETRGDTTTEIIPLYDGTGHVVALTDINKNLLASYAYGPFGEKIAASGPRAQSNPWRWVTKYLDEETGLYYFGHRYFDPVTGQWLSREPLGESESVNLYVYAGNDPINYVDVLGLKKKSVVNDWRVNPETGLPELLVESWETYWKTLFTGDVRNYKKEWVPATGDELYMGFSQVNGVWATNSYQERKDREAQILFGHLEQFSEDVGPVVDTMGIVSTTAPLLVYAPQAISLIPQGSGTSAYVATTQLAYNPYAQLAGVSVFSGAVVGIDEGDPVQGVAAAATSFGMGYGWGAASGQFRLPRMDWLNPRNYQLDWSALSTRLNSGIPSMPLRYLGPQYSPIPRSYLNLTYNVNMSGAPVSSGTNAAGHPRNSQWFWKQMLQRHPELFNSSNRYKIEVKEIAPIVNKQWLKYFPSHAAYKGRPLIHHHHEQGAIATPVPDLIHYRYYSDPVLHPNL